MKSDGLLGRNFLKGVVGDTQIVILCGAGHNMRKIRLTAGAMTECCSTSRSAMDLGFKSDTLGAYV